MKVSSRHAGRVSRDGALAWSKLSGAEEVEPVPGAPRCHMHLIPHNRVPMMMQNDDAT